MTVDREKLVRMGEQVAANLDYDDDAEGLVARVADHLSRFWDPRMKAAESYFDTTYAIYTPNASVQWLPFCSFAACQQRWNCHLDCPPLPTSLNLHQVALQ